MAYGEPASLEQTEILNLFYFNFNHKWIVFD